MAGIPPALPSDPEDVAWALQTADALWKRGERVDAVVWVRRAAQAAGEGEDSKRAANLARQAAELGDWIGAHSVGVSRGAVKPGKSRKQNDTSLEALDALLGGDAPSIRDSSEDFVLSTRDVEVVSAKDFEAGFGPPPPPRRGPPPNLPQAPPPPPQTPVPKPSAPPHMPSDSEVMTVSLHAPDVEIIEEGVTSEDFSAQEFPEEEPTPVVRHVRSPVPAADVPVPSAAQAHAGLLDPWAESDARLRKAKPLSPGAIPRFEEDEVVTSAKRNAAQAPPAEARPEENVPPAPKAPRFPAPRGRAPAVPAPAEDVETTTYRQINPRAGARAEKPGPPEVPDARTEPESQAKPAPKGPPARPPARPPLPSEKPKPETKKPAAPAATKPVSATPREKSVPPAFDLLEMVDAVTLPEDEPLPPPAAPTAQPPSEYHPSASPSAVPSAAPTPRPSEIRGSVPASGRPTAPPPSSIPVAAIPSAQPTRPRAGETLLDLGAVEALSDLPDDAREAFGRAATIHAISVEEEVSHFALALVVEGKIDVSATFVEAPALRLEKDAILRSRGTLVPGVPLRLLCSSEKAIVATWDDAAVAEAFRSCPWVEEDLRTVADRVQAKVGVTMGPLGERFDLSLREHLMSKLTIRTLAPGEVLVAEGKPVPIAIVGVGEIVVTSKKSGDGKETLRAGDFVFPSQTLAHAAAPGTATAGEGGAIVLYGDRAVSQELLMGFPPLLELLASI